ncbi:unnamed protein product [Albugo candida]|uniref:Endonuclease V n=1 Tax=Albugo candida TaxID=65357 RepID=A0A024G1K4_9STRA|nr:unnamed protein product [Albugo candida]|eukprot:CCI40540.1 unnamed protein product [Albugo candida]
MSGNENDIRDIWRAQQETLKQLLDTTDTSERICAQGTQPWRIGGVDISFCKTSKEHACASLVIVELPSMRMLYEAYRYVSIAYPYIPGFLAFRELPAFTELLNELMSRNPELRPDVLLVDGNGVLHPRGFGSACHLGIELQIPTIGVAKSFFHVDGLTKATVVERMRKQRKNILFLKGDSGRIWGAACCFKSATNPVYVSVGHRVSLDTSIKVVEASSLYRVPEPIRQADLRSRRVLRDWEAAGCVNTLLDRYLTYTE